MLGLTSSGLARVHCVPEKGKQPETAREITRKKRSGGRETGLAEHLFDVVWILCSSHYSTEELQLERAAPSPSNEYL